MTVKARRGGPRRNIPSTRRNGDRNVCPIIQGDVPRGSIDKDMHYERTEGWELGNILGNAAAIALNVL